MTLIAAFRVQGIPAIVGDLLITNRSGDEVGQRRKIAKIHDKLVIAWTGHLSAAELVLSDLRTRFRQGPPTWDALQEALELRDPNDLRGQGLHLVGWLIDSLGEHCFRWNSEWPREVFCGDPMYDGSGGNVAEALFGPAGITGPYLPPEDAPLDPAEQLVAIIANLMAPEIAEDPVHRRQAFGFGYEALLFRDGRFIHVGPVLYAMVDWRLGDQGRLAQFSIRDNFVTVHSAQDHIGVGRPEPSGIRCDVVRPIEYDSTATTNAAARHFLERLDRSRFAARFYCFFVPLSTTGQCVPLSIVLRRNAPGLRVTRMSMSLGLDRGLVKHVLDTILSDVPTTRG